jgi:C_GCAxxG_C_C family probable redox protein
MQDKIATESFKNGFNCAQSIVSAFAPAVGISRELSLKLATGLGAGVNYNGNTCGAVLGSYIILGLHYGIDTIGDEEGKKRFHELAEKFTQEFLKSHDSINCKELLKADVSNPEDLQKLREENVFKEFCPKVVKKAASILEKILEGKL